MVKNLIQKYRNHANVIMIATLSIVFFFCTICAQVKAVATLLIILFSAMNVIASNVVLFAFTTCFSVCFDASTFFYFILALPCLFIFKDYVKDVVKGDLKFNVKVFFTFLILMLYMVFTNFSLASFSVETFLEKFVIVISVYLCCSEREKLDFKSLARAFSIAVIVSGFIYLILNKFLPDFAVLYARTYVQGILRLAGCTMHTNVYTIAVVIAISSILILKYYEKISMPEFLVFFVILFALGIQTISRTYVIAVFVSILAFYILYFIKNKFESLNFLLILAAIMCLICLMFGKYINALFYQISNPYEVKLDNGYFWSLSEEEQLAIMNGEVHYDGGRLVIWKLYITKILSNPINLFFGYGMFAPEIGQMHAHNAFLMFVYNYGIVGVMLLVFFVISMIGLKNIEIKKSKLSVLILILGYFVCLCVERNKLLGTPYIFIIAYFSNFEKLNEMPKEKVCCYPREIENQLKLKNAKLVKKYQKNA